MQWAPVISCCLVSCRNHVRKTEEQFCLFSLVHNNHDWFLNEHVSITTVQNHWSLLLVSILLGIYLLVRLIVATIVVSTFNKSSTKVLYVKKLSVVTLHPFRTYGNINFSTTCWPNWLSYFFCQGKGIHSERSYSLPCVESITWYRFVGLVLHINDEWTSNFTWQELLI